MVSSTTGQPGFWATSVGTLTFASPLPDGSTSALVGSSLNITWIPVGAKLLTGAVAISIYPASSMTLLATVTSSTPSTAGSVQWLIPPFMTPGQLRAIIVSTVDAACTATAAFTLLPFTPLSGFVITSPGPGAVWFLNSTVLIAWSSYGSVASGTVTLALAYGSVVKATITLSPIAAALGRFAWTVPANILPLPNYYSVTLSSVAFPNTTAVSAPLDVRAPAATGFAVLAPLNGSSFYTFTAVDGVNALNVSYAGFGADAPGTALLSIAPAAGGASVLIAAGLPGANASLSWANTSWLLPNTWYSVQVCSEQAPTDCASSLVLVLSGPTYGLRLLSPNVATWYRGSPIVVTWQAFHPYITFSTLVIDMLASASMVSVGTIAIAAPAASGSYVWVCPLSFPAGTFYLRLTSSFDGTIVAQSTGLITVLGGALVVTSPAPGSVYAYSATSTQMITWVAYGSLVASTSVKIDVSVANRSAVHAFQTPLPVPSCVPNHFSRAFFPAPTHPIATHYNPLSSIFLGAACGLRS